MWGVMRRPLLLGVALAWLALPPGSSVAAEPPSLTVFAAADLAFAFRELAPRFEKATGLRVTLVFGSTGNFAYQIREGGPADVFFAADRSFVDALVAERVLLAETRTLYAQGRIVLVTAKAFGPKLTELRSLLDARVEEAPELRELRPERLRGDEDDPPLRVERPRLGEQDALGHERVHERPVGGEEHVRRSALADLIGEVPRRAEDERDARTRRLLEARRQLPERERKVRRGEHRERRRLGGDARAGGKGEPREGYAEEQRAPHHAPHSTVGAATGRCAAGSRSAPSSRGRRRRAGGPS